LPVSHVTTFATEALLKFVPLTLFNVSIPYAMAFVVAAEVNDPCT